MGLFTGAIAAFGIIQAGQQISAGYAARGDARSNALVSEHEAGVIDVEKDLSALKFLRLADQFGGQIISRAGGSGLAFSGSPMAVFTDVGTQIETDKLIEQFNLESKKRAKLREAEAYREQGRRAVSAGYSNAFSTLLMTGLTVGQRMAKPTSPQLKGTTMRSGFDEQYSYFDDINARTRSARSGMFYQDYSRFGGGLKR